jgi:hypothetical protein
LILTKIDELCEEVHDDIKITYHSRKVGEVVRRVAEMFGVRVHVITIYCDIVLKILVKVSGLLN